MQSFLNGMLLGLFCLSTLIVARTAIADDPPVSVVSCPPTGNCHLLGSLCFLGNGGCTGVGTADESCVCAARYAVEDDECGCGYWFP